MIEYVLLALQISSVPESKVSWNPVPISVHSTYKECENAYNDLSGFPRRPNDYGWPRYNAMLKCKKVLKE